jgi:hypothetical protein
MACFHFSYVKRERKEDVRVNKKSIWMWSLSGGSFPKGRRFGSNIKSHRISSYVSSSEPNITPIFS